MAESLAGQESPAFDSRSSLNPEQTQIIYRESNYNPKVTISMLESIFGYSRQTFINWEKDAEEATTADRPLTTPHIKARIEKHPKYNRLNKRLYSVEDVRTIWQFLRESGKVASPELPTSIAVWSNKGGVGKSFLSKELAAMLSTLMGFKVLLVDCDLQADCTLLLNCDQKFDSLVEKDAPLQSTIRDIIGWEDMDGNKYKAGIDECLIHLSPTLSVLPSDDDLAYIDLDLRYQSEGVARLSNIETFLKDLRSKYDYDIVIFDCPPNIGEFVHNVLWACDRLLVPVEIEAKCLHTINRVFRHLNLIGEHQEHYRFDKIVAAPNKYHAFQTLHQQAMIRLKQLYGDTILSKTSVLQHVAAVGKSDERKQALFMGPFSSDKDFNIPIVKRFSNAMWNLAHELLDIKPHKELFSDSPVQ